MADDETDSQQEPLIEAVRSADADTRSAIRAYLNEEHNRNLPRENIKDLSRRGSTSPKVGISALGMTAISAVVASSSASQELFLEDRETIDLTDDAESSGSKTDAILEALQGLNISVESEGDTLIIIDLKPPDSPPSTAKTVIEWLNVIVSCMVALTLIEKLRQRFKSRSDVRFSKITIKQDGQVVDLTDRKAFLDYVTDFLAACDSALSALRTALDAGRQ